MSGWFDRFSARCCAVVGHPLTFFLAIALMAAWGLSGPFLRYSDGWQLTANTSTTLITTLVVLLNQNDQTRSTRALHAKLDELIRVQAEANDALIGSEQPGNEGDA